MNRLCIYLTYDKQGIVDDYVIYMLKALRPHCNYLAVVSNQKEIIKGYDTVNDIADNLILRDNIGFDAGGFKDALCEKLGWDFVCQYDEVILANDSFFGPFTSFAEIFNEMDTRNVDFWGLIKHGTHTKSGIVDLPEHIQSFFTVFRRVVLNDKKFQNYWECMLYYKVFDDVVRNHEIQMTQMLARWRYTYAAYADTACNDSLNYENNYQQYRNISFELIKKRHFPFLKKQQLAYNTLDVQTQENLRQALDYIKDNTDYDVNMIWDNVIRTMNLSDLQRSLHLQYILCSSCTVGEVRFKAVLFVIAKWENALEYVIEYLDKVRDFAEIHIMSDNSIIRDKYQIAGYQTMEISAFWKKAEVCCNYDYVGMILDDDLSSDVRMSCTGKSKFFACWSNMLKDLPYLVQIDALFKRESRLGILYPPTADFGPYFGTYGQGWDGYYGFVEEFINKWKLNAVISPDKPPFSVESSFWMRGCVLENLVKNKALWEALQGCSEAERAHLLLYLVQDSGYYAGIVEHEESASMALVNMRYYLQDIVAGLNMGTGQIHELLDAKKIIFHAQVNDYCKRFSRTYVYGTGDYASEISDDIDHIDGYVVSDGRRKEKVFKGKKIYELSELDADSDIAVIVCVSKWNQAQIIPVLEKKGIKNYYCI